MYARMVKGHVKPGKFELATRLLEKDVIPLLKRQEGFRDEITFFDKDHKEGFAISFWDNEKALQNYERKVYPEVRQRMADAFEELPIGKDFEVANSTWYKIHAA